MDTKQKIRILFDKGNTFFKSSLTPEVEQIIIHIDELGFTEKQSFNYQKYLHELHFLRAKQWMDGLSFLLGILSVASSEKKLVEIRTAKTWFSFNKLKHRT